MCGIIAYLGKNTKVKNLINVLKRLEYRGYDSAGVTYFENDKMVTKKQIGAICNLEKLLNDSAETNCLIAHTRWATHGKTTVCNAHPHLSHNEKLALVHNGIIENFNHLKSNLKFKPQSETDTAVLVQHLSESGTNSFEDFVKNLKNVSGSYALAVIKNGSSNELFLAKQKSPLYVAKNNLGDFLVASDPICFDGFSKEFYVFNDGEFAHLLGGDIVFLNSDLKPLKKQPQIIDVDFESATTMGYEHFMLKEIFEQHVALKKQIKVFQESSVIDKLKTELKGKFNNIKIVGCGTAYHASLMGAKYFSKIAGVYATGEMASEFVYSSPVFADKNTLFIFVSQSGETADTLAAVKIAKQHGATTLALTNVLYSSLASMCDYVVPVCAGPEIAVASTKAYVCQLSALYVIANCFANTQNEGLIFENISMVADKILSFDKSKIDAVADRLKFRNDVIFIGKDLDYITACEASLKLKEVSYINSASYPAGELKHGFLALVETGTPVVVIAGSTSTATKTFNAASESVSRGAEIVAVTNILNCDFENVLFIDEQDELLFSMLSIAPLQYLAYRVSVAKGINPDQPRNLAKSVTVE